MAFVSRFGGILAALVLVVALFILGFASAQSGFLLVGLLCAWPLLWFVSAWTIRGVRDNYQLVPKEQPRAATNAPRMRAARQAIPEEF